MRQFLAVEQTKHRVRILPPEERNGKIRRACAQFWLDVMFVLSRRAPWLVRGLRDGATRLAWRCSRHLREVAMLNGARILGEDATSCEKAKLGQGVLRSFYDFIHDIGRTSEMDPEELRRQIIAIEGEAAYRGVRSEGRGAIIATAHMGSFELGMTAMLEVEKRIHVVFQRDDNSHFEVLRREFRRRMGIMEAAVNDGWGMWLKLREALGRDEVVAMQADRAMPGQKGVRARFLGGHALFPEGPAKLAAITGAPIIPVFCIREAEGRVRVWIEEAIWVNGADEVAITAAIAKLAGVIGGYVKKYPEQWLVVQPAWCEDMASPARFGSEGE